MYYIICPTLLFINNVDWENNNIREQFIKNLAKLIEYIQNNNLKILWCTELDELLWMHPVLHPWLDKSNISLIKSLDKYIVRISVKNACIVDPPIITNIIEKDITFPILLLSHSLISQCNNFNFFIDKINNHSFTFSCKCHQIKLSPNIIYIFDDTISITKEIHNKWDKIKEDYTIFTQLLEVIRTQYFPDKEFVYEPQYESSFIRTIYKTTDKKERILYDIAYRMTLLPIEVSQIQGFHDEDINGQKKNKQKRSFRVNDVCRVYYDYKENNVMIFKQYTGSDGHEKGTRHTK